MNKTKIIAELENMVLARLFSRQPWFTDRETSSAVHRKLVQMGLLECVSVEPLTWRITPLGNELDFKLFWMFMGCVDECEMPIILEEYGLIDESEADDIWARMTDANAESILRGYVRRAYFDYRKATNYLH
jgi:hypothetical protein